LRAIEDEEEAGIPRKNKAEAEVHLEAQEDAIPIMSLIRGEEVEAAVIILIVAVIVEEAGNSEVPVEATTSNLRGILGGGASLEARITQLPEEEGVVGSIRVVPRMQDKNLLQQVQEVEVAAGPKSNDKIVEADPVSNDKIMEAGSVSNDKIVEADPVSNDKIMEAGHMNQEEWKKNQIMVVVEVKVEAVRTDKMIEGLIDADLMTVKRGPMLDSTINKSIGKTEGMIGHLDPKTAIVDHPSTKNLKEKDLEVDVNSGR
jgi:hypothetical protein